MEVPISSSIFQEKDNKIELSKSVHNIPKFEDIIDIKNYNSNNNEKTSNELQLTKKSDKIKLKFCYKKIGHTFCLFSDKMGNPLIMIGPDWRIFLFFVD